MRGEFLTKGHKRQVSLVKLIAASLAVRPNCCNPGRTVCCVAAPPPREVVLLWNQGPRIWFPITGPARCRAGYQPGGRLVAYRSGAQAREAVAPCSNTCMSAPRTRARGDEELSAKKGSDTEGAGNSRHSKKSNASERSGRKRPGDLGRALRTVYDDTLREPVPDDFLSLIGKLS